MGDGNPSEKREPIRTCDEYCPFARPFGDDDVKRCWYKKSEQELPLPSPSCYDIIKSEAPCRWNLTEEGVREAVATGENTLVRAL